MQDTWIFLMDSARGRLLVAKYGDPDEASGSRLQLREVAELQYNIPENERGPQSSRKGRVGINVPIRRHEEEERQERQARQGFDFLLHHVNLQSPEQRPGRILLLAPPKLLGQLRRRLPKELAEQLELHPGEFTTRPAQQLSQHPELLKLLQG